MRRSADAGAASAHNSAASKNDRKKRRTANRSPGSAAPASVSITESERARIMAATPPFPRHPRRPIFRTCPGAQTSLPAIRRSIPRRTRPSRRAPRPIGRIRPRPSRRWSGCSIRASRRAPPAWARAPGLTPPPDNSFERRADFAKAHTARKSTKGLRRGAAAGYVGAGIRRSRRRPRSIRKLAQALGYRMPGDDETTTPHPEPRRKRGSEPTYAGVTATAKALEQLLREGRPEFNDSGGTDKVWTPHRPPRPEKSEGGQRFVIKSDFEPKGDQPPAIDELVEGVAPPRPHAGAARRHRLGQDLHHGEGDRGDAAPGADPRAQQDAGGAALRRVQELLPRQRGRVFRLLLRLLPAGSLRPAHRHLYREGILDQRADRPHAPLGDARAARARRRHHRRLGVVHLRHRLGRDLFGDDVHAQARRAHRPAPADRRPGRAAIQAHRRRFLPRHVPRARRHHRHLPGALRGPRLAREPVRRRGRIDRRVRSAHRRTRPTSWSS